MFRTERGSYQLLYRFKLFGYATSICNTFKLSNAVASNKGKNRMAYSFAAFCRTLPAYGCFYKNLLGKAYPRDNSAFYLL